MSVFPLMVALLIESRHSWKLIAKEVGGSPKMAAMTNSLAGSKSYEWRNATEVKSEITYA